MTTLPEEAVTLWAVNIQGPDDLIAAPDYLSAVRMANAFNAWWLNLKMKQPHNDAIDARMWAAPTDWPENDAQGHADELSKPHPEYQWLRDVVASHDANVAPYQTMRVSGYFRNLETGLVRYFANGPRYGKWEFDLHAPVGSKRYSARILSAIEAASPLSKLKAGNARLEDQLAEALKALDGLLKPFEGDDCRYDHHGYCQAHFLQEADECCVKIARRVLEGGEAND